MEKWWKRRVKEITGIIESSNKGVMKQKQITKRNTVSMKNSIMQRERKKQNKFQALRKRVKE